MEKTGLGKHLVLLFISIFLVGMGFSIIMPVLPYYAESMGANAFQLGMLITVYAICQFIFAPIWGAYSDRMGRKPVLLIGVLGFAVTFILFGYATQLWMLYPIRIAGGILSCATMPTAMAYVGDSTSLENEARQWDGRCGDGNGHDLWSCHRRAAVDHIAVLSFCVAGLLALANAVSVWLWLPESLLLSSGWCVK